MASPSEPKYVLVLQTEDDEDFDEALTELEIFEMLKAKFSTLTGVNACPS